MMFSVKRHIDRVIIPLLHFRHNMCGLIVRRVVRTIPSGSGDFLYIKYIFMITQDLPERVVFIIRVKIHAIITQLVASVIVTAHNDTCRAAYPVALGRRTCFRQIKLCGKFIQILLSHRKHTAVYICRASVRDTRNRYFHDPYLIGNHLEKIIGTVRLYFRQFEI